MKCFIFETFYPTMLLVSERSENIYSLFQLLSHIFKTFHTNPRIAHKMQNASHLLQNEALHLKYHKHISKANTFAVILIPVCFIENCVLCFAKRVLWNWKAEN